MMVKKRSGCFALELSVPMKCLRILFHQETVLPNVRKIPFRVRTPRSGLRESSSRRGRRGSGEPIPSRNILAEQEGG
jgi:hypothetical protein